MAAEGQADRFDDAAERLAAHRTGLTKIGSLPDACRPRDLAEAYQVQARLAARLQVAGYGRPVGYKIGCTTAVMQDYLRVDHPCVGRLYDAGVVSSGADLDLTRYQKVAVELEIAVRLGADLPRRGPPYRNEEAAAAVAACMASLEIVDDRYVDWRSMDTPTLVADDFFSAGCVLGSAVTDWQAIDLGAEQAVIHRDGEELGRGRGDAILGHPLTALTWLANSDALPDGLKRGEVITLGSVVQTVWIDGPCAVSARYSTLGKIAVRFV